MKIYHYTTFDTFVEYIMPKWQLKYSKFTGTNDPKENVPSFSPESGCMKNIKANTLRLEDIRDIFFEEYLSHQMISFCTSKEGLEGCLNPVMWAHYGENHKGVCIEIDTELLTCPSILWQGMITYKGYNRVPFNKTPYNDTVVEAINEYFQENKDDRFFTKLPIWSYEQEYRIITKTTSENEKYLDISNAVTRIICGRKMTEYKYAMLYLFNRNITTIFIDSNKNLQEKPHMAPDIRSNCIIEQEKIASIFFAHMSNLSKKTPNADQLEQQSISSEHLSVKDYYKSIIPRFEEIFGDS